MENFGLGLIIGFQDNASSGIQRVISMVENLKASLNNIQSSANSTTDVLKGMSATLGVAGGAMTAFGLAGASAIGGFMNKVVQMGAGFEQTKIMLAQLYGSAEAGKKKFEQIQQLSAHTEFSSAELIPAYTRLKAVGIEADKYFTVIDKGVPKQRMFIEALGDLATMRPDKGLEAVIREGIEFIEGNARPLKMSFGLDFRHEFGYIADSAEGRAKQFVDMISKRGYAGIMGSVNDSWKIIFSNLGDHFQQLAYWINENGFFNQVKQPFKDLQEYLNKLFANKEDSMKLGKAIADGFKLVAAPAIAVFNALTKVLGLFVEFSIQHPKIVSLTIAVAGLGSQLLTLGGVALMGLALMAKLKLGLMSLKSSTLAWAQTLGIAKFSLMSILRSVLPVTIAFGALTYAYKNNIFGLRTIVGGTLEYISNLFDVVSDAMTHIDVDKLTFSLSKKNADLAESMGITNLLKGLATAYTYADRFFKGVEAGVFDVQDKMNQMSSSFENMFKDTPLEGLTKPLQDFSKVFNGETANSVMSMGHSFGEIAVTLLTVGSTMKTFSIIKGVFSSVKGFITPIVKVVVKIFNGIRGIIPLVPKAFSLFKGIFSVIKAIGMVRFAVMASPLGIVISLITLLVSNLDLVWAKVQEVWDFMVQTISDSVERLKPLFSNLGEAFSNLCQSFPILGEIFSEVWGLLTGESEAGSTIISTVLDVLGVVFKALLFTVVTVIEGVISIITLFLTVAVSSFEGIALAGNALMEGISSLASSFENCVNNMVEFAKEGFGWIKELLADLANTIDGFFNNLFANSSKAQSEVQKTGALAGMNPQRNALGGIYANPILTWVAEAGYPEAIIPLDGSARGLSLWEEAGRKIGAIPASLGSASAVNNTTMANLPSSSSPASSTSSGGNSIVLQAGAIQFTVNTDNFDADKAAKMIIPILKRQAEIVRMTSRSGGAFA